MSALSCIRRFSVFTVPSALFAGVVAFGPSAAPVASNELEAEIRVGPAAGSSLDKDSEEIAEVSALLRPLSASLPECPPGKVADLLEDAYGGAVAEQEYAIDYRDVIINGQLVHKCFLQTDFQVDFGGSQQVLVEVIQSRIKN
jgi:hypothetical protein